MEQIERSKAIGFCAGPRQGQRVRTLAILCVLGLQIPWVLYLLPKATNTLTWVLDLLAHCQWGFAASLVLFGVLATCAKKRWGIVLIFCSLPWFTASEGIPVTVEETNVQVLTIASANVHLSNLNAVPLINWVRHEKVDILVVIEVSPPYAQALETVIEYPFRTIVPDNSPFGMALLSRYPVLKAQLIRDADGIPRIEAQIRWHQQIITIIAYHPMPPISSYYSGLRNRQLHELAQGAIATQQPTILAGDLNATPWSSAFNGLAKIGMRRATGIWPTWPTVLQGLQGLPIDQILVTEHWRVVSEQRGPYIGSDHFPVLVRLIL